MCGEPVHVPELGIGDIQPGNGNVCTLAAEHLMDRSVEFKTVSTRSVLVLKRGSEARRGRASPRRRHRSPPIPARSGYRRTRCRQPWGKGRTVRCLQALLYELHPTSAMRLLRPTTGDNSHRFSTATAARELP